MITERSYQCFALVKSIYRWYNTFNPAVVENVPRLLRSSGYFAQAFFRITTTSGLIQRLKSNKSLRQICGFSAIPSVATFSRRQDILARQHIMKKTLYRTKKGETRAAKKQRRLARQRSMSPGKALRELDNACTWGCKRNSQGNVQFWKGYKLHLDVTDLGIPVTAVVTGANVHDSQVAIPMEKLAQRNFTHLYSLMDAGYDAAEIFDYISATGRVALIDRNKRQNDIRPPIDPASRARFRTGSTVGTIQRSSERLAATGQADGTGS